MKNYDKKKGREEKYYGVLGNEEGGQEPMLRFVFPLAGTVYVPVCFPAFQPDQCICKEEEEGRLVGDCVLWHVLSKN